MKNPLKRAMPRSPSTLRPPATALFFAAIILLLPSIASAQGRLLLPSGKPAAGSQVSIPGIPGSVRAGSNGEFVIDERARVPFVLVVIGAGGEIYPPVSVGELIPNQPLIVQLEPTLRESVTVMSGVAPNIEAPAASGISIVGREDLEERRPEHLVDALVRTPGIEVRGSGPAAVPVVRGLSSGRTLLLLDDSRVTAERRAGPSGTFLDPFTLASIEISRGPGSVAYGSDALGGVIHARPRDPILGDNALNYHLTGGLGARPAMSAGLELSHGAGTGAILAVIHARSGDDGSDGDGSEIPNSSYDDHGVALRYLLPTSNGLFRVGVAADRGRDLSVPAADIALNRTFYPDESSDRLTIGWDSTPGGLIDILEMRASLGSYAVTTDRERLPVGTTTRQIASAGVDANDITFRTGVTHMTKGGRVHGGVDFVSRFGLRADGFTQSFDLTGSPTTRVDEVSIEDAWKRDLGLFLIYDWQATSRLALSGGARIDRVESENRGGFFGDRERSDTAPSGHVSATFTPLTHVTATLQASSGYRDPTLSDRYFRGVSGRGFVVGNPDLEPERSLQYDGALRWQSTTRSVALLAYHYTIRDLVERFREGNDFNFRNRGEAEVKGVELEMATNLPARFSLAVTASLARGEASDGGTPLDDIAAPNAHAALRWSNDRLSAFAHGFFFARDDRPGPVETTRPGYATLDAGAGWRILTQAEIRMHVRNLTDRTYAGSADANSALAYGRNLTIGINGTF